MNILDKIQNNMRCIICHSPEIEKKQVNEEIHSNSDIIYVPVLIPVCRNCGERYYDRQTMQYLERTREKVKKNQLNLREVGKVLKLDKKLVLC